MGIKLRLHILKTRIFSLNHVFVRPTKLWKTSSKLAKFVLSKSFFSIKNQTNLYDFFFCEEYLTRRSTFKNEMFWKLWFSKCIVFLKCAQFLSALIIIFVGLTMTLFSDKMLISHRCISTWFDAKLDQKILEGIY